MLCLYPGVTEASLQRRILRYGRGMRFLEFLWMQNSSISFV